MKIFIIVFLFLTHFAYAQVPQGIPYQAAARNAAGQALVNTAVKVRFSIIDSVATGTTVYQEIHSTTTNSVGLFYVNVGMGTVVTGTFAGINWGKNAKFIKMELDITGTGSSYVDMGTQQMLSVPYALYAGSAANLSAVSSTATINGVATNSSLPSYIYNCGNGSDGNFISTNGAILMDGQYKNVKIQAGHTVYLNSRTAFIRVQDTCFIAGTLSGVYLNNACTSTTTGGGTTQSLIEGSCSGAGGKGYSCGYSQTSYSGQGHHLAWSSFGNIYSDFYPANYDATILASTSSTVGNSISSSGLSAAFYAKPLLAGGHGGGQQPQSTQSGGAGGCGGKGLYIIAKYVVFTGTIDLHGNNGYSNGGTSAYDSGGSGGGGGSAIISAEKVITNSGTFNTNGGSPGTGMCSGFKGGNGAYLIIDR